MSGVAIVVPVLNEEELLPSFLAKVVTDLEDAKFDWELILVNDGSTDSSGEIMRTFVTRTSRARLVELNANQGPGANLYEAFRIASKPAPSTGRRRKGSKFKVHNSRFKVEDGRTGASTRTANANGERE